MELLLILDGLLPMMDFRENVQATLLYFDLFDHPLSASEIYTFFPQKMGEEEFEKQLSRQPFRSADGLFHVRRNDEVVFARRKRERKARTMLYASRVVGSCLKYFPFVRGVYLSGSLSKGVNPGDADVDLFIITPEDRLWICRSILTAFKKMFLFNKKKFLCPNYFVSEGHLEIPEKNIFTATELITLRPLYNASMLQRLLDANRWISLFFPNFRRPRSKSKNGSSMVQRFLEIPMSDGNTSNWDDRLMHYFDKLWEKRYPGYTPEERDLDKKDWRD